MVFSPGKFAVLFFAKKLEAAGLGDAVTTVETGAIVYAEPGHGLGHVTIRSLNKDMLCAAYPARKTNAALERMYQTTVV